MYSLRPKKNVILGVVVDACTRVFMSRAWPTLGLHMRAPAAHSQSPVVKRMLAISPAQRFHGTMPQPCHLASIALRPVANESRLAASHSPMNQNLFKHLPSSSISRHGYSVDHGTWQRRTIQCTILRCEHEKEHEHINVSWPIGMVLVLAWHTMPVWCPLGPVWCPLRLGELLQLPTAPISTSWLIYVLTSGLLCHQGAFSLLSCVQMTSSMTKCDWPFRDDLAYFYRLEVRTTWAISALQPCAASHIIRAPLVASLLGNLIYRWRKVLGKDLYGRFITMHVQETFSFGRKKIFLCKTCHVKFWGKKESHVFQEYIVKLGKSKLGKFLRVTYGRHLACFHRRRQDAFKTPEFNR